MLDLINKKLGKNNDSKNLFLLRILEKKLILQSK